MSSLYNYDRIREDFRNLPDPAPWGPRPIQATPRPAPYLEGAAEDPDHEHGYGEVLGQHVPPRFEHLEGRLLLRKLLELRHRNHPSYKESRKRGMQRETLRKGRLVSRAPRRARNTPPLPVSALRPAELRQNPQLGAPVPSPAPPDLTSFLEPSD